MTIRTNGFDAGAFLDPAQHKSLFDTIRDAHNDRLPNETCRQRLCLTLPWSER